MDKPDDLARPFHRGLLVQPNCEGCPLQGEDIIPPEGDPTAKIAIVGEAPGYNEAMTKRVFAGAAGRLLAILLDRAGGGTRSEYWLTNTILCRPKTVMSSSGELLNPDKVQRRAALHCQSRLIGELRTVRPKAIIGFGSQSVRSVYDKSCSLKGRRGGVHAMSLPVIPTVVSNPAPDIVDDTFDRDDESEQ